MCQELYHWQYLELKKDGRSLKRLRLFFIILCVCCRVVIQEKYYEYKEKIFDI